MVAGRGVGMGLKCLLGTEFPFREREKFGDDGGDGCIP